MIAIKIGQNTICMHNESPAENLICQELLETLIRQSQIIRAEQNKGDMARILPSPAMSVEITQIYLNQAITATGIFTLEDVTCVDI